jgi:amino acid adenylation domain-containing protein/non-ribosomal peptide synthase protein (TIGR01720 family)
MLVDAIQPQRSLSQTPLFQAMFVLQNAPARAIQTPGLALEPLEVESGLSMFDLTLTMSETPSGLTGALEYNSDLFDAATAQRFLRHFRTLLEHIVDSPDVPLSRLPMLSAEERRQLLYTWNDTQTSYPSDKCIHQLVEEQAARTPGALAVIAPAQGEGRDRERTLTYSELNRRANCLAYYLRRLGAGPEVMVGICLERSLDLMVGLLGVLKAGSAYVPLDPAYPQERLAYMLADARLPLLLTHRGLDRRLPANSAAVVRLDADWPAIAQESEENPMIAIQPENLAYVIYTSGSTGKPKGVQVPHRGVVNHNAFMVKTMGITAADRVLQFATINFDTAAEEIYPTWYTGATLVLRPAGELLTAADLLQLVEAERITILDFPTAYWHEWVYELALLQRPLPPSLRLVIVGGEKASAERYALWQKLAGKVAWLNGYGPTEGTIIGALYDPTVDAMPNSRFEIPIGRPIANDQIYLLDRHMEPVPIGVAGDLHIGGAGVARGYLNHPDLTAERFVVDPFAADPGVRLYKTGDLGRYRADGQIEYVGRADGQVKIRGFRIELGEIEAALSQHQAVREAVALARDGETPLAPQRLVAYVVLATPGVTPGDLRSYLAGKLPDYMVPSAIVLLDALPLMPNGKVDRRALPAPDRTALATGTTYVAPRTQAEEVLARIWGQVLGREQVSVRDNFFELGGDSILSIQVIARANQAGLILTPKQLFQYPTIEGLAQVAGSGRAVQAEQDTVTGPVPLTPIQHWFFEQNLAEPHHFNQSLLLAVRDGIAPAALQAAFDHLQAHHDALRLRFLPLAANWQQEIAGPGQSTQLLRFDLSAMAAADQDAALFANSARIQASLNLTEGPLLQVALFDLGAQRGTRLFITIHHLAVDGVSWRILLEDLLAAYTQLTSGQSVALPPKTTSFKAWAERLAAHARSDALRSELAHWLAIGGCTIPRLPVDSLGDNTEASARDVVVSLSQEDTTALLYDVPPVYGTEINDVLLASLALAHSRWTGSPHLLLDLEGHGREALFDDVDLSRTVGWFTTVYPVLLTVQPQAGPGAVLKSIKEQARRVPQRGLGFGLLRYLTPDGETARLLSALPQPQISFNYLGQFDQAIPEGSPFTLAVEATGPDRSVRERRSHLIDVSAGVAGGRLQIAWTYSQNVHQRDTIECLAQDYLAQLQAIIRHCQSPTAGGYTPSDFPLLRKVSQDKLDRMLAKYRSKDRVSP